MYKEIKKIQEMIWIDDDLMCQETLFELQDYVCNLLLKVAQKEDKVDDLVKSFPYMYQSATK